MSSPADPVEGYAPLRPSPVAVLAVAESVGYGLVARHAFDEGSPAAAALILGFLFLLPAIVGYRTVSSSDERRVGVLAPAAAVLMMLAAGVALGGAGVAGTLLLMPLFMLMALLGGVLALLVRGVGRAALSIGQRLARATRSLRGGAWEASVSPAVPPQAERNRDRPAADPGETWRQIIIRTPF